MNTMINLIKLHYTSIFALKKPVLIILAIAVFASISNVDGTMIPFAAGLIIMMLNYNTLAYEDRSKSNYLIYSLPVKLKQYILSKYIFGALNIMIAIFFGDLIFMVFNGYK
ncbi:MAG: ABC-2 transporter permease [Clostridium sp.]|nr:ABC-2 transporter permease [Clostridium sp.]